MIAAVTAAVVCVILILILFIRHRRKKAEEKKYYDAAARMIKENTLDEIILSRGQRRPVTRRMMIYIRVAASSPQGFVFDPEKGIRIGRDPDRTEICIRDKRVSATHCCLCLHRGTPVVQDFHSSNGTWIRRFLRKKRVQGSAPVQSGDRLYVGDTKLEITFFFFDMMDL